ncbi:MAG: aspartate 1-decarboxylase [Gemmataceae bacterium]
MTSAGSPPTGPLRFMLKAKLHRATVTHADLHYEGSLTMDRTLMAAADILEWEEVHVWNVTRGTRFRTYAMEGEAGSGVICSNGAAAHLAKVGDIIIVATYTQLYDAEARKHRPRIVLVGRENRIMKVDGTEVPGPRWRA